MMLVIPAPFAFDGIITLTPDDLDTLAALITLILSAGGLGWLFWRRRR